MLNNKIERLLCIFIWFIFLIFLRIIFPIQNIDLEIKIQYILSSTFLTLVVWCLYIRIRNKSIKKKIHSYYYNNDFSNCLQYIDTCISKHSNLKWLKSERLFALALQGNITEYQADLQNNLPKRKKYTVIVNKYNNLFLFFSRNKIDFADSDNRNSSYLNKSNYLLSIINTKNYDEIISCAMDIYCSPYLLFKSFSALVLSETYNALGDDLNRKIYAIKAREYSPSAEILQCVEEHLFSMDTSL